jgi:SSS family transporter
MFSPPIFAAFTPRTLVWPDYVLLAVYFSLNLFIGWLCARRKKGSAGDYFLGGGRVAWWAGAISVFATTTSSISIMALPAMTYMSDWLSFGSSPSQALGMVLTAVVFVGILRRLNITTVFTYLENRFSPGVRLLGAGLAVLLKIGGRMSVVMLLPSLALSTVTGMNVYLSICLMGVVTTLYAMEGGFEAVVWTDVMQVVVTFGGIAVALWYIFHGVPDGLSGILQAGAADGKFRTISWSFNATDPTVWVFGGMMLASAITNISDQPVMQRVFAAKDAGAAKKTLLTSTAIAFPASVVFFFIGSALYVFYKIHPERLAAGLPNDAIFPYFVANELPAGVVGLIVAALFAAAMGALSSALNATAAIIVVDVQGVFRPGATEAQRVKLARRTTLVAGVIATGMAAYIASMGVPSLWEQYIKLAALIGGGFPGVFALGLLTRRASATGVVIGAVGSIAVTWWVQTFTHTSVFLHGFVAVFSCMAIGYAASLAFPAKDAGKRSLRGLTVWEL